MKSKYDLIYDTSVRLLGIDMSKQSGVYRYSDSTYLRIDNILDFDVKGNCLGLVHSKNSDKGNQLPWYIQKNDNNIKSNNNNAYLFICSFYICLFKFVNQPVDKNESLLSNKQKKSNFNFTLKR